MKIAIKSLLSQKNRYCFTNLVRLLLSYLTVLSICLFPNGLAHIRNFLHILYKKYTIGTIKKMNLNNQLIKKLY